MKYSNQNQLEALVASIIDRQEDAIEPDAITSYALVPDTDPPDYIARLQQIFAASLDQDRVRKQLSRKEQRARARVLKLMAEAPPV